MVAPFKIQSSDTDHERHEVKVSYTYDESQLVVKWEHLDHGMMKFELKLYKSGKFGIMSTN